MHTRMRWRILHKGSEFVTIGSRRKPVFGVSAKAILKQVPSATGTSYMWKIKISFVSSLDLILSKKRITKALISLRGCAFGVRIPPETGFLASRPIYKVPIGQYT